MKRALLLVAILLLPTVLAEDFPPQRQNSSFVGWQLEANEKIGEYRLSYPAVGDGEEINMAQNGPFAVVVSTLIVGKISINIFGCKKAYPIGDISL